MNEATHVSPVTIERSSSDRSEGVSITWSNASQSFLSAQLLRSRCPCATCTTKRGDTSHESPLPMPSAHGVQRLNVLSSKVLSATADDPRTFSLEKLWAVGNYALGIRWADGHDTGIYSFEYLRELAEESA